MFKVACAETNDRLSSSGFHLNLHSLAIVSNSTPSAIFFALKALGRREESERRPTLNPCERKSNREISESKNKAEAIVYFF